MNESDQNSFFVGILPRPQSMQGCVFPSVYGQNKSPPPTSASTLYHITLSNLPKELKNQQALPGCWRRTGSCQPLWRSSSFSFLWFCVYPSVSYPLWCSGAQHWTFSLRSLLPPRQHSAFPGERVPFLPRSPHWREQWLVKNKFGSRWRGRLLFILGRWWWCAS